PGGGHRHPSQRRAPAAAFTRCSPGGNPGSANVSSRVGGATIASGCPARPSKPLVSSVPLSRSALALSAAFGATVMVATLLPVAPAAASATSTAAPASTSARAEATASATDPAIIVTEILANTTGDDHFEYVEIHNTTTEAIDLAAQGYSFAYSYNDSDDRARDVPLAVEDPLVLAAGETALLWLSYTAGTVDSFARTVEQVREYHAEDAATQVVRLTGQNGMANGGDRGIRVLQGGELHSWSHYPAGSMAEDLAVHCRLP